MPRFQRRRDASHHQRATTLELFYDLVFVFAVTQVSRLLTGSLSYRRLGGALACLAVGAVGAFAPGLVVGGLLLAILVAVIASEQVRAMRRGARGEPSPLERLEAAG
jgi:Bacterial low temperature requirement A protein (LtrA)